MRERKAVCVCMSVCVRAHVCLSARVRACVCVYVWNYIDAFLEKGARISPIQRDTSALLFIIES